MIKSFVAIMAVAVALFLSGCTVADNLNNSSNNNMSDNATDTPQCPDCNDNDDCTQDLCGEETNYTCQYEEIISVECGNKCPEDCSDGDLCTTDYCGSETDFECRHVPIISAECGNACPSSCDDNNNCTEDYCSAETNYKCVHNSIRPCCGDGICEPPDPMTGNIIEGLHNCYEDCFVPNTCGNELCEEGESQFNCTTTVRYYETSWKLNIATEYCTWTCSDCLHLYEHYDCFTGNAVNCSGGYDPATNTTFNYLNYPPQSGDAWN